VNVIGGRADDGVARAIRIDKYVRRRQYEVRRFLSKGDGMVRRNDVSAARREQTDRQCRTNAVRRFPIHGVLLREMFAGKRLSCP
jgi:hypothetical protein